MPVCMKRNWKNQTAETTLVCFGFFSGLFEVLVIKCVETRKICKCTKVSACLGLSETRMRRRCRWRVRPIGHAYIGIISDKPKETLRLDLVPTTQVRHGCRTFCLDIIILRTIPLTDVSLVHFFPAQHNFPSNPALTLLMWTANNVKQKSRPRLFFCCIFCHRQIRKFFNIVYLKQPTNHVLWTSAAIILSQDQRWWQTDDGQP